MYDITVVTPTGDRPEALQLCDLWVRRQEFEGALQWVVIDDGERPWSPRHPSEEGYVYVRLPPQEGKTVSRNLIEGLRHASADIVVVMEDDEWYSKNHVRIATAGISKGFPASGVRTRRNYQIMNRCWVVQEPDWASLARTSFHRGVFTEVEKAAKAYPTGIGLDCGLWRTLMKQRRAYLSRAETNVGVKQMPGRGGAGSGHSKPYPNKDPKLKKFKEWIGSDFQYYERFF